MHNVVFPQTPKNLFYFLFFSFSNTHRALSTLSSLTSSRQYINKTGRTGEIVLKEFFMKNFFLFGKKFAKIISPGKMVESANRYTLSGFLA